MILDRFLWMKFFELIPQPLLLKREEEIVLKVPLLLREGFRVSFSYYY
jgi:hypothetical protein